MKSSGVLALSNEGIPFVSLNTNAEMDSSGLEPIFTKFPFKLNKFIGGWDIPA